MKIILENVVKGISVTGVAKVQEDNGDVLNNVPFNVRTIADLDIFVANLLAIQTEFSSVIDGEYVANPVPIKVIDPLEEALREVYKAERDLKLGIIDQTEYDAVVLNYKTLASGK